MDGVRNKIAMIGDESQAKLQDTMQKIVNDSNGGMVCIINLKFFLNQFDWRRETCMAIREYVILKSIR